MAVGCPTTFELAEPLSSGDEAPDVPGLDLEQGDSVVWTFPKSEGCRCGQQALDLNRLAREHGVNVYGIASADREELDEMSDRLGLDSITLIPDLSHDVAEKFGVGSDEYGRLERRIFFVRDGRIQDVTDGMDLGQPNGGCPAGFDLEQAEEKKLFDVLKHPGVYVTTGKRGSGKSSLAFRVGEGFADRHGVKPVTVGMPHGAREHFPDRWLHVEEIDDAPPQSVVIVDEAYAKFHSRESMSEENKDVGKLVNTSRHCQQTYIFVSQNASYLDKNAVSEADGLLLKEPGTFHMEFERRQFRDLSEKAKAAFDQLPANLDNREYVYVYSDEHQGMIKNTEASFYGDSISRSFSTACEL